MVALVFLAIHRVSSGVLFFDDTLAVIQLLNQSGIVHFMRDAPEKNQERLYRPISALKTLFTFIDNT